MAPFLHEDFSRPRDDVWQTVSGQWAYTDGRLVEKQVASFATIVTKQDHPRDFRARVRYRTLPPGTYRSVGFSFDYADQGTSQDVYSSTGDAAQSVQAFHRTGGQQVYPPAGIVRTPIRLGDETTVEVGMRFSVDRAGSVTELKYWRGSGDTSDTDVREGHLWRADGTLIATALAVEVPIQFIRAINETHDHRANLASRRGGDK